MSHSEESHSNASQNFTLPKNPYAVLDAYDSLALARCSEIYLQALEHYILVNIELDRQQILHLLRLYRSETAKGFDKTASILKSALERNWEGEGDE